MSVIIIVIETSFFGQLFDNAAAELEVALYLTLSRPYSLGSIISSYQVL